MEKDRIELTPIYMIEFHILKFSHFVQAGDGDESQPESRREAVDDDGEEEGGLGWTLPHTVRGFLTSFSTLVPKLSL